MKRVSFATPYVSKVKIPGDAINKNVVIMMPSPFL